MLEEPAGAQAGGGCRQRDEACGELPTCVRCLSFSTLLFPHRQGFEGSSRAPAPGCAGITLGHDGVAVTARCEKNLLEAAETAALQPETESDGKGGDGSNTARQQPAPAAGASRRPGPTALAAQRGRVALGSGLSRVLRGGLAGGEGGCSGQQRWKEGSRAKTNPPVCRGGRAASFLSDSGV